MPMSELNPDSKPRIQEFLDVQHYLKSVYDWRKSSELGFSYSQWASEIGFRSRSFLRLVVTGKRSITESSIPLFVKALKLSSGEARYFEKLVRFTQASALEQRQEILRELMRGQGARFDRSEIKDYYDLVSTPIGPRLQVLLSAEDIAKTPENLAELMGASQTETSRLLEKMKRLGLAREISTPLGTEWRANVTRFEIKDHLGDLALQSFHRKSLEEASHAISLPIETRHYQSAVFFLSESEYKKFREEMSRFIEATLLSHDQDQAKGRRLYQLNLGLIPVSKPILRADKFQRAPVGEFSGIPNQGLKLGSESTIEGSEK
jgi:uncharacterized protein (TIGR02147 family)